MANTPNIDLVKPAGTDHALVSVLNSNSDKIDAFAGTTNQAIANMSLNFPLEDDTVAEIYARLNTITVGKTVTFYSAWKMLDVITSGQIQATATGVITRYSTGQFEFLFKYGAAEAATMRVEGMSASSVGTVTLNKLALQKDVVTVKQYSVTTVANSAVSPFSAFVQFDVSAADRSAYGNMVSAICHASSTNPAMCMITGGEGGVLVYSKSAATFNVDVVFSKNRI